MRKSLRTLVRRLRPQESDVIISIPSHSATFSWACEFFPSFNTHVHAALPRHEVVAAPSAARVDELLAHLRGCVVVIPRNGG